MNDRQLAYYQAKARTGDLFGCHVYYLGNEPWPLHQSIFDYLETGIDPGLEEPPEPTPARFVAIPPGFGKSTIIQTVIVKTIIFDRNFRWLIGSKASKRAVRMALTVRQHLEYNGRIIRDFGVFKGRKWTEAEFDVCGRDPRMDHPTVRAVGTDTATLGTRADSFVGDDLLDLDNTRTDYRRRTFDEWISTIALSRLEPAKGRPWPYGTSNVIGNILHRRDWYNVQIDEGRVLPFLRKAYIDDDNTVPILPELYGTEALDRIKGRLPISTFRILFLLDLRAAEGAVFSLDWKRWWTRDAEKAAGENEIRLLPPLQELQILQGWDFASGEDQAKGCYVVGATIGRHIYTGAFFILAIYRKRVDAAVAFKAVVDQALQWEPLRINCEKNFHESLVKFLAAHPHIGTRINPIRSTMDKTERIRWGLQPIVQRGDLYWPETGVDDEMDEFFDFPGGDYNDVPDAVDIALKDKEPNPVAEIPVILSEARTV